MPNLLLAATTTVGAVDPFRVGALVVLAFLCWRLVLVVLFPFGPHKSCKGSGKHRSGRYWRPCRGCGGSGRRIRFGRRVWDWAVHGREEASRR